MRAASMEILAVSWSRISPTMMMSGSCRRNERRARAKSRPALAFTWVWLMPGISYSTGSSMVVTLTSGVARRLRIEKVVNDLPEPVGPVIRLLDHVGEALVVVIGEAELLDLGDVGRLAQDAHHRLLPVHRGERRES